MPPEEPVAVFDNDGTLWFEMPMPVELGFILKHLFGMAVHDASLRERQPWKAAATKDFAWLRDVITHYAGDEPSPHPSTRGLCRTDEARRRSYARGDASATAHACHLDGAPARPRPAR